MIKTKELARLEIKDKNCRIYIPSPVREILKIKQFDEISFHYNDEDVIIRKNIVSRKSVKTISQIKQK